MEGQAVQWVSAGLPQGHSVMSDVIHARHLIDTAEHWLECNREAMPDRSARDEYYSVAITLKLALKAWLTVLKD